MEATVEYFDGRVRLEDLEQVVQRMQAGQLIVRIDWESMDIEKKSGKMWYVKGGSVYCEQRLMHKCGDRLKNGKKREDTYFTVNQDYLAVDESASYFSSNLTLYSRRSMKMIVELENECKIDRIFKVKGLGHIMVGSYCEHYDIRFWLLKGMQLSEMKVISTECTGDILFFCIFKLSINHLELDILRKRYDDD